MEIKARKREREGGKKERESEKWREREGRRRLGTICRMNTCCWGSQIRSERQRGHMFSEWR